jgi:hypothetical protein
LADAPRCDVTIVCGGPGWRAQVRDAAMLAFLRSLDPLRVASVSTGALPPACSTAGRRNPAPLLRRSGETAGL